MDTKDAWREVILSTVCDELRTSIEESGRTVDDYVEAIATAQLRIAEDAAKRLAVPGVYNKLTSELVLLSANQDDQYAAEHRRRLAFSPIMSGTLIGSMLWRRRFWLHRMQFGYKPLG